MKNKKQEHFKFSKVHLHHHPDVLQSTFKFYKLESGVFILDVYLSASRFFVHFGRSLFFLSSMQDIEVKQVQAMRKVDIEMKLTIQKQAELLTLQNEMEALIKEQDQLVKRVERNAIYHQFLEKVVQARKQVS